MPDSNQPDPVALHWQDYLRDIEPDPRAAMRVRRALALRLGAPRVDARDVHPVSRAAAAIFLIKSSAMSVGLALVGLGTLHLGAQALAPVPATLPTSLEPTTTQPPTQPTGPSPAAFAPATTTLPAPAVATPVGPAVDPAVRTPAAVRRSPSTPAVTTPTAAVVATDALRAEIELMDRAREALARRDDATVLALLAEHVDRFPRGAMLEERRAWTVIARCRRDGAAAHALAERFVADYPRSGLIDDIHHVCSSHSSTDSTDASETRP